MARVTTLLVGVVVVGMIMAGLTFLMSDLSDKYSMSYDDESINKITSKLEETRNISQQVRDRTDSIEQKSGLFDIVGDFFSRGYNAFKIAFKSFDITSDIIEIGSQELRIPSVFSDGITTIILTVIFVGIVLYAIFKVQV
jgi:hypothetical protein